ncbi:hypothetical protein [Microbacterium sp. H1-D42]|uniref:hypothetical protein n=1 Tax=Microbacterium sp. H1-D42 TaxID=2925844 RepID=UPI001F52EE25|nr:hypothetical protein [Microbacterium sp. H1-D42]UNK72405.1 hypothetical protein MNR00_08190 [Microbacterium sp. H1-D42]
MTRTLAAASTIVLTAMLAACSATPTPVLAPVPKEQAVHPSADPVGAEPAADAAAPVDTAPVDPCDKSGWIAVGMASPDVTNEIVDQGARELAAGTVGSDAEGRIVTYTVASGDAPDAIGARLCLRDAGTLAALNHTRTIHPGQVLRIYRDPALPQIDYYSPAAAPAGFKQIPYQSTLEAMGVAADAGDIAAVRRMWTDTLSGMLYDPALVARIQEHIDTGDIDVLRQMFS